jgi:hypothetical protein
MRGVREAWGSPDVVISPSAANNSQPGLGKTDLIAFFSL